MGPSWSARVDELLCAATRSEPPENTDEPDLAQRAEVLNIIWRQPIFNSGGPT
jgi:hypothetical protein